MCENRSRVAGTWCGQCYANLAGRSFFAGHLRGPAKGTANAGRKMALSKPVAAKENNNFLGGAVQSDAAALYPSLMEYITGENWDDGSTRTTASLLLFYEAGLFKVCLNDRATERTGWATGATPELALSSLDRMLASDGMEWRKSKAGARRK